MGTKLGAEYMLWIEGATAGTYNLLGGQKPLSFDRTAASLTTGTKATYPYITSRAGAISISIGCDGQVELPDANGFTRVETKFLAREPIKVQIRKDGTAGVSEDAVFECEMAIISFPVEYPEDGLVSYKLSLEPFAAPTIDTLA